MKNIFFTVLFAVSLLSCKQKITKSDLLNLNGDWEITQAEMPDGQLVEYDINMNIDYFELDSLSPDQGIRKKFMPQFDGTRLTNGIEEQFFIIDSVGTIFLHYKTDYANWMEEVLSISANEFEVKNENDIIYRYKKFVPIVVEKEKQDER